MDEKTKKKPQKYSFQHNGDADSCYALADLLSAGWEFVEYPLETREGYHWIKLQRWR